MKQSVLVVGHADADGHLIAEQVRRNLALIESFSVSTVVDPARTKDHNAWLHLDLIPEIEDADIVFFVDMMFAPATFVEEARALVDFVDDYDDKRFFLIDHHPLPLRRLAPAENLRVLYRPEVFDCAVGPRSGMMVAAAICEGQRSNVSDIRDQSHDSLAMGVRRAAAPGGPLPGEKLLALMRSDCWQALIDLGEESREFHRLPRGRRAINQPRSNVLTSLEKIASDLLAPGGAQQARGGSRRSDAMAYDVDIAEERFSVEGGQRRRVQNAPIQPRDLETILTILEVAALSLTKTPDSTFTRKQLIKEALAIVGGELDLREEDINIVLHKQGFLQRVGSELRLR
ncbi:MAG TPA: hypothetical protein VMH86_12425 [Rhizomicrobium sp.]|nr:hypothetical protein [Rhizomicrobium sp.]